MDKFNPRKSLLIGVAIVGVLALALGVVVTPAAADSDVELEADCLTWGGAFSGSGTTAKCSNATDALLLADQCPGGESYFDFYTNTYFTFPEWITTVGICHNGPSAAPLNYGMERKGLCKLVSAEDSYLGGTITAVVRGKPVNLKLKADGKTYVLPLVPGSVVNNGDGTYTAQFYIFDPETGQALVPAGDYPARCHGWAGSNDGGSNNTVSISY